MENFGGNSGKKIKPRKSIRGNLYLLLKRIRGNPAATLKSIRGNLYLLLKSIRGNPEKHTRQLVFATKKHKKHTRQLVFATKKHTRQPWKAYAATCICYLKAYAATRKSIRGNLYLLLKSIRGNPEKHTQQLVFATKKPYAATRKSIGGNLYLLPFWGTPILGNTHMVPNRMRFIEIPVSTWLTSFWFFLFDMSTESFQAQTEVMFCQPRESRVPK